MRVTKEVAAENRRKILETATQLFKVHGFDNVSVADLTKVAGFTHGGFYNHFGSKADLAAETVRYAFDKALSEISRDNAAGDTTPMADRLANYLSAEHRDNPGGGCPTGSLPVDVGRSVAGAQQAYADGLERYIELIEDVFPASESHSREAAIATLSTLVGAIILSRAVREGNPELSDEILRAASFRTEPR
ncbi:TetR/AcrR family transcriptional regulator [Martelella mediterranea]|uniref:TetR/AcrR family transcriptional regulator n=1 Tax=Martelella mediterranea TaxID=293089 RepID=UPI001E5A890B|nr:TetR/AcrR family transcriptional regulator [Martelella mediterranea]MCD1636439.1 TetR/AcrR family transcriptional regulator [Martelella mediterranea]